MTTSESTPETPPEQPTPEMPPVPETVAESAAAAPEAVAESAPAPTAEPARVLPPIPEVPPAPGPHDLSRIAQDFQIRKGQVEAVLELLDEGCAVPFIVRYRKARTGALPEEIVRGVKTRIDDLRFLAERKKTILKSIAHQGHLTDDLAQAIIAAEFPRRLDDLYLPYKPKKKSHAAEARERGWGNLADAIWTKDPAVDDLATVVAGMFDPETTFTTAAEILAGVQHILAERIGEDAEVRGALRAYLWDQAQLTATKMEGLPEDKGKEFREFFEYHEPVWQVPPQRIQALNRGEREKVIVVKLIADATKAREVAVSQLPLLEGHPHRELLLAAVDEALEKILLPSLEREIRRELTDRALEQSIHVFGRNLMGLLMQPPMPGHRVLAIDPGLRTGCKLAVLDEAGQVLETGTIYPHAPQKRVASARKKLEALIRKHGVTVVAIGNGTGGRETEHLIAELIAAFDDRRLNPQPTLTEAAPSVVSPPAVETATESVLTEALSAPVTSPTFAETVVSTPVLMADATVLSTPVGTEAASVVTPEAGEATAVVATATPTTDAQPAAPAAPAEPEIDLSGLPEPNPELSYVVVNEAGASEYGSSPIAKDEFPNIEPGERAAISIGRRFQNPIAELVKIDPQYLGMTHLLHDAKPRRLKDVLEGIVESCVNRIGVDLNAAGLAQLRYIAGFNPMVARDVIAHRTSNGPFRSIDALRAVPSMTENRLTQAAGFLKLAGSDEPLDVTIIHPELFDVARQILSECQFAAGDLKDPEKLKQLDDAFRQVNVDEWAEKFQLPFPAVISLMESLARPYADPRDDVPPPVFKRRILKMDDLAVGMELKATVLNVVPFGAFVDLGMKESGLVHISQMANRYIKSPYDIVAVGDVVPVWVVEVKPDEKKISLTMIPPGTPRRLPGQHEEAPPPPRRREAPPRPHTEPREPRPVAPPRGEGRGAAPPRSKRFAEPGAWRRSGKPAQSQPARTDDTPPAPASPPPPPKKQRVKPVAKLSSEQKTGKAALNSFGQLFAFIKQREEEVPPPAGEPPPEKAPE